MRGAQWVFRVVVVPLDRWHVENFPVVDVLGAIFLVRRDPLRCVEVAIGLQNHEGDRSAATVTAVRLSQPHRNHAGSGASLSNNVQQRNIRNFTHAPLPRGLFSYRGAALLGCQPGM